MLTSRIRPAARDRRPSSIRFTAIIIGFIASVVFVTAHVSSADAEDSLVTSSQYRPAVDLTPKPVPRLAAGIVLDQATAAGYSDLVTLVLPRLAAGHVDSLPEFSKRYASMFKFTVLANVTQREQGDGTIYLLDRVGIGFAMDIKGQTVVVTQDTANNLGARLGVIDRSVLGGNEDCLDDIIQIARTDRLIIFDAKSNMCVGEEHEERIIRHFIWASPASGKIGFLVWLMKDTGANQYELAEPTMQLLPSGFREDRVIHVSDGGILSSIPTPDRFALVTIPQGTPVPFSEKLKRVSGNKALTQAGLQQLVSGVAESLAQIQADRSSSES